MSKSALERISNLQGDDLFLSFDADEIPTNEVTKNAHSKFILFL